MGAPERVALVRANIEGAVQGSGDSRAVGDVISRLRVLAVIDGNRLTGPARQLLATRRCSRASITVATFQRSAAPTPFLVAARKLDVPTCIVPDRFPGDPRTAVALARLAAESSTDILQTHGYKANILAALVKDWIHRPWIAFLHGETWENWKVRTYFALERLAIRRADRIVVVSQQMARALQARGIPAAKLRVIHNACLVDPHACGAPTAWSADAPPVVGVVGRLSPEKGVDLALVAHRWVTQRCPAARLWIVGDGPEQMRLTKIAQEIGLGSSVEWLGYRDDPAEVYRQIVVLLVPSRSEGLPNVVLEAMAHGIPVVAAAVGGVPEVVSDGETGFLVPPSDTNGLASRVVELLQSPALRRRLGQAAQDHVVARFSPTARCQALLRVYEEACA
ncbi:MAG TPA: glycosyltransferase [bacterium]